MSQQTTTPAVDLSEPEECVLCWVKLDYPKGTHIEDPRRHGNYVEGSGQLCDACADDLHGGNLQR